MQVCRLVQAAALVAIVVTPTRLNGQNRPYTDGSVWDISMVRTTEGMRDDYLRSLGGTWKHILDEAKQQGLVLSYKVIATDASGLDDWDLLLMIEYKNWAAFDGLADKVEPLLRKIVGSEEQARQLQTKRLEIRRIVGDKRGQELILK